MSTVGNEKRRRVLLLSNGHGEDEIAAVLGAQLAQVAPELELAGFPLVGAGRAYAAKGIPVLMAARVLPSGGFTRNSLGNFLRDVKAGLFGQIGAQVRMLRQLRGKVDLAVCAGDVYLLTLAGLFLKQPIFFLPTAKSDYIASHLRIERRIMRRFCRQIFPRDARTAVSLARQGLPAEFVGNLMMDCLTFINPAVFRENADWVILLLPGSREEAYVNMRDLAAAVAAVEKAATGEGLKERRRYFVALAGGLNFQELGKRLGPDGWVVVKPAAGEAEAGVRGHLKREDAGGNGQITIVQGRFGDLLAACDLVIGLAGTGNEQAAGMGKPVLTFPGRGAQFTKVFAERQKRLLGDAVSLLAREPELVARTALTLLRNPAARERMGQCGRERMGAPGGARKLALRIKEYLA
ncbi:MAG TPA: lipid-A-disaccharide synthase-related protein [Capillibacterium sp.]